MTRPIFGVGPAKAPSVTLSAHAAETVRDALTLAWEAAPYKDASLPFARALLAMDGECIYCDGEGEVDGSQLDVDEWERLPCPCCGGDECEP